MNDHLTRPIEKKPRALITGVGDEAKGDLAEGLAKAVAQEENCDSPFDTEATMEGLEPPPRLSHLHAPGMVQTCRDSSGEGCDV